MTLRLWMPVVLARRVRRTALTAVLFVGLPGAPVLAHHSPAAFDRTKEVTLVGTVKEFRWQNPHTWIEVLVPDAATKKDVLWGVELTSPTYLVRAGWKSNLIKPGDKVTIVVNPVRSGEPAGIFKSLTLADGRTFLERPARLGTAESK